MPEYHPSDRVTAILNVAASSPELLDMLVKNRERALARMGLSPEERAALMSLSAEELLKLVRRSGQEKALWRLLRSRVILFAGIILGLVLFASMTADGPGRRASDALVRISVAEGVYRQEHGVYGALDDLVRGGVLKSEWIRTELDGNFQYEFEIALEGDTFTATAQRSGSNIWQGQLVLDEGGDITGIINGPGEQTLSPPS